jgi:hypothetical protein
MHTICFFFLYVYLLLLLFKIKQITKNQKQKQTKKLEQALSDPNLLYLTKNNMLKQTIVYLIYLPIYYMPVIGSLLLIIRLNRHSFYSFYLEY